MSVVTNPADGCVFAATMHDILIVDFIHAGLFLVNL